MQLALLNGNFRGTEQLDVDSRKDLMARAVYSFKFRPAGIGIDVGAHGYYGGLMAKTKYVSDYENQDGQSRYQYKGHISIKNGAALKSRSFLTSWWPGH